MRMECPVKGAHQVMQTRINKCLRGLISNSLYEVANDTADTIGGGKGRGRGRGGRGDGNKGVLITKLRYTACGRRAP